MNKGEVESIKTSISIDLTSISEKSSQLVNHLKAPDFFDMSKNTVAKVDISDVKKTGGNQYEAKMKLTMKGITQNLRSQFR